MKKTVAQTIANFAKSRENAYQKAGSLQLKKMQAISKIKGLADLVSSLTDETQIKAIRQIEPELMLILPDPRSRFHKMRENILQLIQKSHD